MGEHPELSQKYDQAQAAIARGDLDRAVDLLKQIVATDEEYRDASRLLAEIVTRQRRRWYNDRRLWIGMAGLAAIPIILLLVEHFRSLPPASPPQLPPTATTSHIPRPTASPTPFPTMTPRPSPTPIPLAWRRIYTGEQFSRFTVTTIVFDPHDREVIYIGTDSAGVYKSIDGGLSWQPAHQGLGRAQISSLVIDPDEPNTLYAGVVLAGVYKSTNGAQSWHAVNMGIDLPGGEWISIVAMDPQNSKHLYYYSYSLYETQDSGKHWSPIQIDGCPSDIADIVVHPLQPETLFATEHGYQGYCKAGVYQSDDSGATWRIQLETGMGMDFGTLEIDSGSGVFLAAVTWEGEAFYSIDGGDSWRSSPNVTCQHLAFNPFDPTIWYCASYNVLQISQDMGQSWRPTYPLRTMIEVVAPVSPSVSGPILIGGQGLFLSTDGGASWISRNDGLGASRMELYAQPGEESPLYVVSGAQKLYRSQDGGRTWELVVERGGNLSIDVNGEILYLGSTRSEDGGQTWRTVNLPTGSFGNSSMTADTRITGAVYFAAKFEEGGFYFYVSPNSGRTWTGDLQKSQICDPKVFPSFGDDLVLYVIGCAEALRSMDGGSTWLRCGEATWFPRTSARLVIHPEDSGHLLAATRGDGVWLSYDSCQSWIKIDESRGLANLYVNAVAMDSSQPEIVYTGTDGGAYVSFDGGEHWGEINEGLLGAMVVYSIVVDPQSNVYAATPYGIFKLESR